MLHIVKLGRERPILMACALSPSFHPPAEILGAIFQPRIPLAVGFTSIAVTSSIQYLMGLRIHRNRGLKLNSQA